MKVKDLDFDLIYVCRYDTATGKQDYFAFNCYEDAIDFMDYDKSYLPSAEYEIIDGETEIKEN